MKHNSAKYFIYRNFTDVYISLKWSDNTKNDSTLENAFQGKKSGAESLQISTGQLTLGLGKENTYPTSKIVHVSRSLCIVLKKVRKFTTPPSKVNSSEKRRKTAFILRATSGERICLTKQWRELRSYFVDLMGIRLGISLPKQALWAMSIQHCAS